VIEIGDRFILLYGPLWYPVCKEEKLEVIFCFFLFRVMRFGNLEFVEIIHQYNSRMVGQELSCKRVGPWISIRPTSLPLTLAPPLSPLGLQPPPSPPLSLGRRPLPSPIFFLLKPLQPSPPKTLAAPPFPPLPRCSPPAWFSVVWLQSQLEFGGRKKEGGREEPKVNL
jgi:hypothetical protein